MAKKPNDMAKDTTNKKALANAAALLGIVISPLATMTVKAIKSFAKKKK